MVFDRLLESLRALIGAETNRLDYLGLYRCRVVSQNADGTLELQPDDARLPTLSGVPIATGVAGASMQVSSGGYCRVAFANGDPSQPFAALFEPGTATIVFNGGTLPVARKTDPIQSGSLSIAGVTIAGLAGAALVWTPQGGLPQTVGTWVLPGAVAPGSVAITGSITDGAPNVKA